MTVGKEAIQKESLEPDKVIYDTKRHLIESATGQMQKREEDKKSEEVPDNVIRRKSNVKSEELLPQGEQ